MIKEIKGKIIKGLGGLYTTRTEEDDGIRIYTSRAKGNLKKDEEKLLVGDEVVLTLDDSTPDGVVISRVEERKNSLIRPPMANLDYLFIVLAAKKPVPALDVVDKLTAICVHNGITPVIVITKKDLSPEAAEEYARVYECCGIPTFITSSLDEDGVGELSSYIHNNVRAGATAAFAGASGVGKSTLMNALFPSLSLYTGEVSKKTERGKHTTRHVEIFDIGDGGYLADTPGFSLIDFARFDFFDIDDLPKTFPDVMKYSEGCRYADCTHSGEGIDECSVARAANDGKIAPSRLESFRSIYRILREKKKY